MTTWNITVNSASAEDTGCLAVAVSDVLKPGDVLLIQGPVGAGKSHFARSAILNLLPTSEDVPSPTYTLVQTYVARVGEVWHADLYRILDPMEIHELGLMAAFEDAICFVEWPDRLGSDAPEKALTVAFDPGDEQESRLITLSWTNSMWDKRLEEALRDRPIVA